MYKLFVFAFFLFSCNQDIVDVEIQCRYQMYACGDCYPQYKITKISIDNPQLRSKLIGKDIFLVDTKGNDILEGFDCPRCFEIYAKGTLKKKGGTFILFADSFERKFYPDCCIIPTPE